MSDPISLDPFKYYVLLDVEDSDGRSNWSRAINVKGGGCLLVKSYVDSNGKVVEHPPVYLPEIRAKKIENKLARYIPDNPVDPEVLEDVYELTAS